MLGQLSAVDMGGVAQPQPNVAAYGGAALGATASQGPQQIVGGMAPQAQMAKQPQMGSYVNLGMVPQQGMQQPMGQQRVGGQMMAQPMVGQGMGQGMPQMQMQGGQQMGVQMSGSQMGMPPQGFGDGTGVGVAQGMGGQYQVGMNVGMMPPGGGMQVQGSMPMGQQGQMGRGPGQPGNAVQA